MCLSRRSSSQSCRISCCVARLIDSCSCCGRKDDWAMQGSRSNLAMVLRNEVVAVESKSRDRRCDPSLNSCCRPRSQHVLCRRFALRTCLPGPITSFPYYLHKDNAHSNQAVQSILAYAWENLATTGEPDSTALPGLLFNKGCIPAPVCGHDAKPCLRKSAK